jgi:hypothetical protein
MGATAGQLHPAGATAALRATQGATDGRQRTNGIVGTFRGITGGVLLPANRQIADIDTADRKATAITAGNRDTATLTGGD